MEREFVPPDPDDPNVLLTRVRQRLISYIESIELVSPRQISEQLEALGYVGQSESRKALALMAHRHVRRLRYIYLDGIPRDRLPPKENHLLVGPTGCGKTYIVELLFNEILRLPTALIDITSFSETGYVGNDVGTILTRLLHASDGDLFLAQVGVVCLDEFDKLATGTNSAVFSGAGTTKDVSGLGVQRELLKLLECGELPVPTTHERRVFQPRMMVRTDDIVFLACGAFSGLKTLGRDRRGDGRIGFSESGHRTERETIAVRYSPEELDDTTVFQHYGFLPELIGRFTRVIGFDALDARTLRRILAERVLPARREEMRLAGMELVVDEAVLDHIVCAALKKETGARGLESALARHLEDAVFAAYSEPGVRRVKMHVASGEVRTGLE